jgi:hypothetical protein
MKGLGYGRKQLCCNLDTIPSLPSRAEENYEILSHISVCPDHKLRRTLLNTSHERYSFRTYKTATKAGCKNLDINQSGNVRLWLLNFSLL